MPMRIRLFVTIRPGSREEEAENEEEGRARDVPVARRALPLDARMRGATPRILEWAKSSPEDAVLLVTDPITAVRRSEVRLLASDQDALKRQIEDLSGAEVLPPGCELVSLDVTVAAEGYADRTTDRPGTAGIRKRRREPGRGDRSEGTSGKGRDR